jgi:hypothetical protein
VAAFEVGKRSSRHAIMTTAHSVVQQLVHANVLPPPVLCCAPQYSS